MTYSVGSAATSWVLTVGVRLAFWLRVVSGSALGPRSLTANFLMQRPACTVRNNNLDTAPTHEQLDNIYYKIM